MAGAGGDEWIYVLSQQEEAVVEDAEAEQAVTATSTVAEQENNNKPSKNPDDDGEIVTTAEDDKASAQPPESDDKAAQSSGDDAYRHVEENESPYPINYTPEELTIEQAYRAFVAASRRATATYDELEIEKASRDKLLRAYIAADYYIPAEESEIDKAFEAYMAAFRRAAEMADELEIQKANRDKASRAYLAALQRASANKLDDDGRRDRDSAAAAGPAPRVMENPCYDWYNDDDTYGGADLDPYYRGPYGGSASASLGLGSGYGYGYDNTYYNRFGFGFGFPGAYGPATGLGYGYDGCYSGEPYAYASYPYMPAAVYQTPPPPFSAILYPLPTPNPYLF